jgi:8-oxo-dGTP pyrophosphatase MutT (NUDIX family)
MLLLSHKLKNIRTKRSGVIPYIFKNNTIYFLFAKDKKTKEYTDFGGGIKVNENALECGIREFEEESNRIFENEYYEMEKYVNTMSLIGKNNDMTIIFLPVEENYFYTAKSLFNSKGDNDEIYDVEWVDKVEFCDLIFKKNNFMWKKISMFLKKHYPSDFFNYLERLYKIHLVKPTELPDSVID